MDLPDLPSEIFLVVAARLSPRDLVRCRRVSRSWRRAFTRPDFSAECLRRHFPRCREMRLQQQQQSETEIETEAETETETEAETETDWPALFALVARRYDGLRRAQPRATRKVELAVSGSAPDDRPETLAARLRRYGVPSEGRCYHPAYRFYRVAAWDRCLELDGRVAKLHYPEPEWTFDQGLLVYPAPAPAPAPGPAAGEESQQGGDPAEADAAARQPYRILDVSTMAEPTVVPFDATGKIVRRVRLAHSILAIEWAEAEPYHGLNERTSVHRHFVSLFDVAATGGPAAAAHRADFKMHFLGLPLTPVDRFLSAHDARHYAVYVWQPNRSPYGENAPIESVVVWSLAHSSGGGGGGGGGGGAGVEEPRVIRRLAFRELEALGVRQRQTPHLRELRLRDGTLYLHEEDHRWASGPQSSPSPPRFHRVWVTGVPVAPPPASSPAAEAGAGAEPDDDDDDAHPFHGPHWRDECGADSDAEMSFCRQATSASASSRARQPDDDTTAQGADAGADGDDSPHRPACWRHRDFPFFGVARAADPAAGVRFAARHCFMLETVSAHVRPFSVVLRSSSPPALDKVRGRRRWGVRSLMPAMLRLEGHDVPPEWEQEEEERGGDSDDDGVGEGGDGSGEKVVEEVQFDDGVWGELLGKGCMFGEERWVVGEDGEGRVSVLLF